MRISALCMVIFMLRTFNSTSDIDKRKAELGTTWEALVRLGLRYYDEIKIKNLQIEELKIEQDRMQRNIEKLVQRMVAAENRLNTP